MRCVTRIVNEDEDEAKWPRAIEAKRKELDNIHVQQVFDLEAEEDEDEVRALDPDELLVGAKTTKVEETHGLHLLYQERMCKGRLVALGN